MNVDVQVIRDQFVEYGGDRSHMLSDVPVDFGDDGTLPRALHVFEIRLTFRFSRGGRMIARPPSAASGGYAAARIPGPNERDGSATASCRKCLI